MRNLFRKPFTWIVIAECVIVGTLLVVAWNAVSTSWARHSVGEPVEAAEAPAKTAITPLPDVAKVTKPSPRQLLPGLNLDSAFWRARLSQLNREQVTLEQIEWRIVHNAMDVVHRYLETVVLPSITRAERSRAA